MPVQQVSTTHNGKPAKGYRWGKSGKIYFGPTARARATAQGQAIYASGYRKKK